MSPEDAKRAAQLLEVLPKRVEYRARLATSGVELRACHSAGTVVGRETALGETFKRMYLAHYDAKTAEIVRELRKLGIEGPL